MKDAIYHHQAQATKRFGVEFRSKLEAQWAYFLEENKKDWKYADGKWFDFLVDEIPMEIKPRTLRHFRQAAERMPDNQSCIIALGEPPGLVFFVCSKFEEMSGCRRPYFVGSGSSDEITSEISVKDPMLMVFGDEGCWYGGKSCGSNEIHLYSQRGSRAFHVCPECRTCEGKWFPAKDFDVDDFFFLILANQQFEAKAASGKLSLSDDEEFNIDLFRSYMRS